MNEKEFINLCKERVAEYANAHLDKADHKQITEIDIKNYFLNTNIDNAVVVGHNSEVHIVYDFDYRFDIEKFYKARYNEHIEKYPLKDVARLKVVDDIYKEGVMVYEEM